LSTPDTRRRPRGSALSEALRRPLHGFAERGIPFVVAQEHVSGDLDLVMPALRACDHRPARPPFKFYGVRTPGPPPRAPSSRLCSSSGASSADTTGASGKRTSLQTHGPLPSAPKEREKDLRFLDSLEASRTIAEAVRENQ
jgi:hypothetical protein